MSAGKLTSYVIKAACLALSAMLASCGGSAAHNNSMAPITPGPVTSNVQPIAVNSGPIHTYANGVFTSVTLCVPASSTCETIDGVLVDTGSYGLRILSTGGGGRLTLSLPQQTGAKGNPVAECAPFVSGYTWGPIKTADISLAGEQARSVPIQVIDPTFAAVPESCKNTGVPADNTVQKLGANGILGVGPFAEDCGSACTEPGRSNAGLYFECASSSCDVAVEPVTRQVQNPVALFSTDNNGVMIQLPAVSDATNNISGSMIFGIGTKSNNGLGKAQVFPLDANGEFTTSFNGKSYPSFVDSGSNALFFLDTGVTGMPVCGDASGFYCPASTTALTAVTSSGTGSTTVKFNVANADSLFSNGSDFVFEQLAGPNSGMFDWGLPFFYGRTVFTAIQSRSTPAGAGPFWAY